MPEGPTLLSVSLKDAVAIVKRESLNHRRVYWLNDAYPAPYEPDVKIGENHTVDLFGEKALCVGVTCLGTDQTYKALLVSDSFSPCVPVVAIGRTGTHLAHCNGTGQIAKFASKWLPTHRVMVIQRARNDKQKVVSDDLAVELKKLNFTQVWVPVVPLDCTIGVVVAGSTILVYPMKE